MRNFAWLTGCIIAVAFAAGGTRAGATVINGSFVGTMDFGSIDTYGYFGTAGADYSGATITGSFTYNTASLAPNSCSVVMGEGCYSGPITIAETIAGAGTLTFNSTTPLVNGLVLYGGFPQSSSSTDEFTITSADNVTGPAPNATENGTTVELLSTTNNFITDASNNAPIFAVTNADLSPNSVGNISLTSLGSEDLQFQFLASGTGAQTTAGSSDAVPEPASMLLLGTGLAGAMALRRRRASV